MVPAVNNMVLCTVSFKRVELMLGVLNTHTHTHTHTHRRKDTMKVREVLDMSVTLIVVMI